MHRMRRFVTLIGLAAGTVILTAAPAKAELIRNKPPLVYPDLAAFNVNGKVDYNWNESTNQGVFNVTNMPVMIAGDSTNEYDINPVLPVAGGDNSMAGVRQQNLTMTLDSSGNLVSGATQHYELWGSVVTPEMVVNGQVVPSQTFNGLLLEGTPTAFGSTNGLDQYGTSIFDANVKITGGALAPYFGSTAYLRIMPEVESTFTGDFTQDFSALKTLSNIRSYDDTREPFPIPEPTTIAVLLAGGLGLLGRRYRLGRRAD